jgi:hypothetical protein
MKTLCLSLILIAGTAFGQTYQAPSENGAVVVAACGTAPAGYPATSGTRAPNTVDVNGNACSSGGGGGSNPAAGATGAAVPADASYNGLSVGGTLTGQTGTNNGGKISADVNITGGSTGNGAASNTGANVPVQADYVGGNLAGTLVGIAAYTDSGSSGLGVHVANTPAVTQSGTWNVTNVSGTVSLPTGASTAAKQPALGTAGSASSDVITVQGAASMTALLVNPVSATVPVVTMNSASANSGVNSALALVFDDVSPTSITENNFGFARMSANRNAYSTIRDAAGNERGVNVNSSNQLSISLDGDSLSTAVGATVTETPVYVGCINETTPTTIANNQKGAVHCTTGELVMAGIFNGTNQMPSGDAAARAIYTYSTVNTTGGWTNYFVQPAASDNHAVIKNGAGLVGYIHVFNNSATVNYGRLYNAGTGFNGCNSATNLVYAFEIPASTTVSGYTVPMPAQGMGGFSSGISICVTSGYATNDTTNATATAMDVNVGWN